MPNTGFGLFFRHGDDLIVTPFAQVSAAGSVQASHRLLHLMWGFYSDPLGNFTTYTCMDASCLDDSNN